MKAIVGTVLAATLVWGSAALAADFRITIPKRSKVTPVQQLNRDGVRALAHHKLDKAQELFYRAYLLDPDDPFTLNNLGYLSELQGKLERAERYYQLAARQKSETTIAESSLPELKGKRLSEATTFMASRELRINRGNVEAMNLLQEDRTPEAEGVLLRTLAIEPHSAFTLNNLGYTMEAEGNLDAALRYYTQAAELRSSDSIIIALDPHWQGKPISEVASDNARLVRTRIEATQSAPDRAARLSLQGVFDLNHNDPEKARLAFEQAYKLDPTNAFTLNNMGYVSEMNGDQETANDYYSEAKASPDARGRVTVANHVEMQGMQLGEVAGINSQNTESNLQAVQEARRHQGGPIELKNRDNTPVKEPTLPPPGSGNSAPSSQTQPPPPPSR